MYHMCVMSSVTSCECALLRSSYCHYTGSRGWNVETKAAKLPTLLEGEALAVWLELTTEQQDDYAIAKKEILSAVMPMGFVSLGEFHQRKLCPGEAILVFVHNLKKLLEIAVPSLNKEAKEPLLLHQFVAGLPEAITRQSRASGEDRPLKQSRVQGFWWQWILNLLLLSENQPLDHWRYNSWRTRWQLWQSK